MQWGLGLTGTWLCARRPCQQRRIANGQPPDIHFDKQTAGMAATLMRHPSAGFEHRRQQDLGEAEGTGRAEAARADSERQCHHGHQRRASDGNLAYFCCVSCIVRNRRKYVNAAQHEDVMHT